MSTTLQIVTEHDHAAVIGSMAKAAASLFPGAEWTQPFSPSIQKQLIFCAAVARHESGYGNWWDNKTVYDWLSNHDYTDAPFSQWSAVVDASNNFGAVQLMHVDYSKLRKPYPLVYTRGDGVQGVLYHDTRPVEGQGNLPYPVYFRKYPTIDEGARDVVELVLKNRPNSRLAATRGDYLGFSTDMRNTTYYEGRGDTREEQIAGHQKAIYSHIVKICRAMGWPLPGGETLLPPTVRLGDTSKDVMRLETLLKEAGYFPDHLANTYFGTYTDRMLREYQQNNGLQVDGICGNNTWSMLLADDVKVPPPPPPKLPDTDPCPVSVPTGLADDLIDLHTSVDKAAISFRESTDNAFQKFADKWLKTT